ncbi:MAG: helicase-related protein [Bradymonadaceae bacterium]
MNDQGLPIDDVRGEVESTIRAGGPSVVVAPTGSGKSTRLPIWMDHQLDGPVLVVEPRRVACRSLASYLADQRGESAGESIGYRVRFDDTSSDRTSVLFATTGVALRMLSADDWPFAGVVIDEFHERGWEVDLIAAVLRRRHREGDERPFVFTSATIRASQLARRLDGELVEAEGRTYPVDIEYRDDPPAPSSRDLDDRVRGAVAEVVSSDDDGDVLVFLPGKGEIRSCYGALTGLAREHDLELLKVHGRLPPSEMAKAFEDDIDRRRVFLATNVAETSVTLPGVTTVIDSGLVKTRVHRGGRSALALRPTSEASMDQRAGRAGRVKPGRCIRLWSRRFRPDATIPPEIERIELDDVMLHAARAGLEGEAFERAPWLSDPPEFAVEKARNRLERVGALTDDGKLTEMGRRLAELPVDAHDARLLIDPPDDLKGLLADVVALLQRSTDLLLPPSKAPEAPAGEVESNRNELLADCDNEVYTQVVALRHGRPREHGLHRSAWNEARKVSNSLREIVDAPVSDPLDEAPGLPDVERFADYLLERIPDYAYVLRERARRRRRGGEPKMGRSEPWANGEVEIDVYPFEPPVDPRARDHDVDHPVAGVILDLFWVGDRGTSVRGLGNMLVPCTDGQLADAGIGEVEIAALDVDEEGAHPVVEAKAERRLAGVTLRAERRELEGRPLCRAIGELVAEGRLFREARDPLLDDLHLWELLVGWPEDERYWSDGPEPPALTSYVEQRLWELGLRESSDLLLVEPEDLRPDLADMLGIAEFELDDWRDDFPRTWAHMGAEYTCEVQPTVSKVILEPANAKAREGDDPAARYLPNFRGFSVFLRSASRVVPLRT